MHKPNFKVPIHGVLAEMLFGASMEAMKGANRPAIRTGPGHTSVLSHHNYINDPRRKWYGAGGRWP